MQSCRADCETVSTKSSVSHICQNLSIEKDVIIYAHNTEIVHVDTLEEFQKWSSDPDGVIHQIRICSLPTLSMIVATTDAGVQALALRGRKRIFQYPSPNEVQPKVGNYNFYRGIAALQVMQHIFLVVGTSSGDILLFGTRNAVQQSRLPEIELLRTVACHEHAVCSAESTLSGSLLATSDESGTVILYDPSNDFEILHRIKGDGYSVTALRFLNDNWLVCGLLNGLIHLHKTSDAKLYARLVAHARALTAMDAFDSYFVTVGEDTFMNVWKLNDDAEMPRIELLHSQRINDEITNCDIISCSSRVCTMPGYEAEETIKRLKSHKGVQAVLIVNQEGIPIYSSTNDEEFATDHAALISQLAAKAKSTIRTLDPTNDVTFLRIRSKKHEIMIAPDKEYALIVIQSPNPSSSDDMQESSTG
uniref:Dynein light chain 2B putative n=1 Tax=Albugo laibachii Nc14 TaxID=890382 RepID=F0WIW7_9STRA|nr:dynein light chain 2B putative [Albugo laibachii Nc14]|eukprot:CCA21213.1 dynein light chain 2B putative [Albugo laibachii Nc14]